MNEPHREFQSILTYLGVLSLVILINCISLSKNIPEVLCKKGALKNLAKFTGKHLCQSHFLNKVADLG